MEFYKAPVILIHGRKDNSQDCFGISNKISKEDNSGYNFFDTSKFSQVSSQEISENSEYKKNSIAENLVMNDYTPNGNLFAFNYPNEDVTYINAELLSQYIFNLINLTSHNQNYVNYKLMYPTQRAMDTQSVKFDIIAHSNGGLVSRYYIENYVGDHYVRKLITIDTPHYGAYLSQLGSQAVLIDEVTPMDCDLSSDSRLFTGKIQLNPVNIFTYWFDDKVKYAMDHQSPMLKGAYNVSTEYYAIGGVAYGYNVSNGTVAVEFNPDYTNKSQFLSRITQTAQSDYNLNIQNLDVTSGDNVIDICTQLGVKLDNDVILGHIPFKKMTLIVNDEEEYRQFIVNGNYSLTSPFTQKFFHNAIKEKIKTHQIIQKYLEEVI